MEIGEKRGEKKKRSRSREQKGVDIDEPRGSRRPKTSEVAQKGNLKLSTDRGLQADKALVDERSWDGSGGSVVLLR